MATRKPVDTVSVQGESPKQAVLPQKVTLEADFICFSEIHGAAITWQFAAGQVVRDAQAIRVLLDCGAPLKD